MRLAEEEGSPIPLISHHPDKLGGVWYAITFELIITYGEYVTQSGAVHLVSRENSYKHDAQASVPSRKPHTRLRVVLVWIPQVALST